MLENLIHYIALSLLILCTVLWVAFLNAQDERDKAIDDMEKYKSQVQLQNDALELQVNEQAQKEIELQKAQEEARRIRLQYEISSKSLLAQHVPADCTQAMAWGARQAPAIHKCWISNCQA